MSRRSSLRFPVRAFVFGSGIGLWVACSSDSKDFFGPPIAAGGKGAQAGAGMTSGGSAGSGAAGSGGGTAATGGTHVGGSAGGSDPSAGSGNASGGAPDAGAPSSGGAGGKGGHGGSGGSSVGGSGLASGTGGEGGDIGSAGTQAGDGGGGGEPSVGGTAGTGGAGMGGTAGGGMGGIAGTAGVAGVGGQPPVTCGGDGDCAPAEYCKKTACDAAMGTCTVRPVSCTSGADAELNPVCGCDQMTYYTKCVAAREGVNIASNGQCSAGSPCTRTGGSGDSCSPHRNRAACYRTRSSCAGTAPNEGVCWVLPDVCPQEDAAHLYCNQGGTPECHGLCDALESKYPLVMNSNQCN